jgi:two-component system CheB/CheR fusion protein
MKKDKDEDQNKKEQLTSKHYMQALIETIREAFLIIDSKLRVVEANDVFYETFKVTKKETEKKLVYELGNGQWNIPSLKKLLEEVLPAKKIVKDYEVDDNFPTIGRKVMLLNANQVDSLQLILLAFEDITSEKELEKKLAEYTKGLEVKVSERTKQLALRVKELEQLNQSMVGREMKMVELKKEIAALKGESRPDADSEREELKKKQ